MKRQVKYGSFLNVLILLVLASFTTVATGETQNPVLDFKLENRTGINIHSIFISSHDSEEWGDDLMEDDILRDGEDLDIEFHPKAGARLWDLRIEDKEGDSVEWEAIDPTKFEVLTLKIVKGKPIAEWR